MPELPDVEVFRRQAEQGALGRRIAAARVTDERVLTGISADDLTAALEGATLTEARRHGKQLFLALDRGRWLRLHFGMTGFVAEFADAADNPRHDRLRLDFADGDHFAFVNQRLFGEAGLVDSPEAYVAAERLGLDALALDERGFASRLRERRGQVKPALMDQSLIAGLGNEYTDEMLFQARIHPKRSCKELSPDTMGTLFRAMRRVLESAIEADPSRPGFEERLPDGFLLPRRAEDAPCPRCGGGVRSLKVGGRKGYLCPACQPEP